MQHFSFIVPAECAFLVADGSLAAQFFLHPGDFSIRMIFTLRPRGNSMCPLAARCRVGDSHDRG